MEGTVTTEEGSVTILREEIDTYRGGQLGCTIYLKDGRVIYSTMEYEEVEAIFD
jgi:hypothetical protein